MNKTKAEEIAVLDAAIKQLGPDSYLGPWLTQIRGGIADLVRCDIFPDITLNDSIKQSEHTKRVAQEEAEKIVIKAKAEADKLVRDARNLRSGIASTVSEALRALERW